MMNLESSSNDDNLFIDISGELILGAAIFNKLSHIHVVHVDNWFGERWVGFRGKYIGAAGVRNRSLKKELVVPPFHPNRVLSECEYQVTDCQCVEAVECKQPLHGHRSSMKNLNMIMQSNGLYAWYSGNTIKNSQGSVMVYAINEDIYSAWYVMYEKREQWQLVQTVGISKKECLEIIELSKNNKQAY